jgi:homogentisate 1,2-dioxygenase
MPFYQRRGDIPPKRHIRHRSPSGALYYEEHVSRRGFSGVYANVYHIHPPTRVARVGPFRPVETAPLREREHRHRHLETFRFPADGDWITGRRLLAFNDDVRISTAAPARPAEGFYRNGRADETIFVHRGTGTLESIFGSLTFGEGDYIVIPRGVTFRMHFDAPGSRLLVLETRGALDIPAHYRNRSGQLLESAPYCERDIRTPEFTEAVDERGEFPVRVRLDGGLQEYVLAHHPFDVVGWDGCCYPWAFQIRDFMPRVGRVHLPPPVHLTFEGEGFVVCSFVPRPFDFHEEAIPIPYAHSSVDSDEVLYYAEGTFMSRRGISEGSMTLHPAGLPHGPQPGLLEASFGARETTELAVMIDTFRPLTPAEAAREVDDPGYPSSWMREA